MSLPENKVEADKIMAFQSDACIMKLYRALKDETKVRWKDSIKEVVDPE